MTQLWLSKKLTGCISLQLYSDHDSLNVWQSSQQAGDDHEHESDFLSFLCSSRGRVLAPKALLDGLFFFVKIKRSPSLSLPRGTSSETFTGGVKGRLSDAPSSRRNPALRAPWGRLTDSDQRIVGSTKDELELINLPGAVNMPWLFWEVALHYSWRKTEGGGTNVAGSRSFSLNSLS